jgi:hypothetical protein
MKIEKVENEKNGKYIFKFTYKYLHINFKVALLVALMYFLHNLYGIILDRKWYNTRPQMV